jgi:oligo-1,6-glucosidase/alpha-glucosidase
MRQANSASAKLRPWWERGTVYQIYPRSFQDSDGDGAGDLEGVRQRLDYVRSLGVDAIWLSPIFPSPMADFGYDVADYCDIDPLFGDLAEFDDLLAACHARDLKLLLDFVPNHTSDQHPWFRESRSSRQNAKRDWYIWRDPGPGGGPPNNWTSDMGGSSWEFDPHTGQYYLHAFLREQPDLNWRNPAVSEAMHDVLRFWFERGVDGFRIDVLWHCYKAADLQDNPLNPDFHPAMGEKLKVLQLHSANQREIHDLAASFRQLADGFGDRLLVGEICLPVPQLMKYYGVAEAPGVHLPFNFQLLDAPWDAQVLTELIATYEQALPENGWPNWVLGSHDAARIAGRLGEAQARVAAMLLLTLRGTPTLYQGDELGIGRVEIAPERVRDPQDLRQSGLGLGRDHARTPMAWNAEPNAGFTTSEPWLPLHDDWQSRNVEAQSADKRSMLNLYRDLLRLRRQHNALSEGEIIVMPAQGPVLCYERRYNDEHLFVALNLSGKDSWLTLPPDVQGAQVLASTCTMRPFKGMLQPDEGLLLKLEVA